MNLHPQAKEMDTAWYYFRPSMPIDSIQTYKNNLTCLKRPLEKVFIVTLEERNTNISHSKDGENYVFKNVLKEENDSKRK